MGDNLKIQKPLPWIDMARYTEIQCVLVCCDVVDDVITLIQSYAKQDKLLILTNDTAKYASTATIFLYDPSSDEWNSHVLEEPLCSSTETETFIKDNKLIVITEDETMYSKYRITITDLTSGIILKTSRHPNIKDEIKTNKINVPSPDNFIGLIYMTQTDEDDEKEIFYNMNSDKFDALLPLRTLSQNPGRVIYSPSQQDSLGRLFCMIYHKTDWFYEYSFTQGWMKRRPPVCESRDYFIDLVYHGHIYLFGMTTSLCQRYNMESDIWTFLPPQSSYTEWNSTPIAAIIDDTILIECRLERDAIGKGRRLFALSLSDPNGNWKITNTYLPPDLQIEYKCAFTLVV